MIFSPLDHYDFKEYHRLTKGMEFEFILLPPSFMTHCEQIVFGNEYKDLSYFCFHLYHDINYCDHYENLSKSMEITYAVLEIQKFKNLANNLSNLLIILREPKVMENDKGYRKKNTDYWRGMVWDDEFLSGNKGFKKYILK